MKQMGRMSGMKMYYYFCQRFRRHEKIHAPTFLKVPLAISFSKTKLFPKSWPMYRPQNNRMAFRMSFFKAPWLKSSPCRSFRAIPKSNTLSVMLSLTSITFPPRSTKIKDEFAARATDGFAVILQVMLSILTICTQKIRNKQSAFYH